MTSVRQAFTAHSETVRDYLVALIHVDSGIYKTDQLKTILEAPDSTIRLETEWLQSLMEVLLYIQKYIQLVERWVTHTQGLVKNLGATQRELREFENFKLQASEFLPTKNFDQKYLRWVLEDAAQELDRLIATSHQLLFDVSHIVELIEQFKGPFFLNVKQIAENWEEHSRRDFLIPISNILQEIDTSGDSSLTLQQFSRYLDTISQVVSAMPIFVLESSSFATYSPQMLQENQRMINQLIESNDNLRQFVEIRSQAYTHIINEQTALWNAVLPYESPIGQVLITIGLNPSQGVDGLIPDPLPTDTLPLAFKQAKEALTLWGAAIEAAIPYLNKAMILNQILQSPTIAKFLQADKERLNLYRQWRPRIIATFEALGDILQIK
ncbi:MAG: hypothetical protein ACFFDJ_01110 [Candidatus Odinarchaeota archaeon]